MPEGLCANTVCSRSLWEGNPSPVHMLEEHLGRHGLQFNRQIAVALPPWHFRVDQPDGVDIAVKVDMSRKARRRREHDDVR